MRSVDSETLLSAVFSPRLSGKISARDISGNRAIPSRTGCHARLLFIYELSPAIDTARAEVCNAAMKRLAAFAVLLVVLAAPAWAGFDEGVAAYNRGDYATALREWRPLAEQGRAEAQFSLGQMYRNGRGVTRAYAEALKWYGNAAAQGHAAARFNLGLHVQEQSRRDAGLRPGPHVVRSCCRSFTPR